MKKVCSLALALTLVLALAGCGGKSESSSGGSGAGYAEDGYAEGRIGDTMHTYFFDYTVNSAYVCDGFEGYVPADGNELLVAEVTVKNTGRASVEMYDTDFQVQWNGDSEEDFGYPITFDGTETGAPTVSDSQLPAIYTLGVNEEETGLLVYEVPAGNQDFSISYLEEFDDESSGDVFFVFFSAKAES